MGHHCRTNPNCLRKQGTRCNTCRGKPADRMSVVYANHLTAQGLERMERRAEQRAYNRERRAASRAEYDARSEEIIQRFREKRRAEDEANAAQEKSSA